MINNTILKRTKVLSVVTIVLISAIVLKLSYSCLFLYEELSLLAEDEHQRSFPLKAKRGIIYDVNMNPLTYNESSISLYAIPYQIADKESVANILSDILEYDYS